MTKYHNYAPLMVLACAATSTAHAQTTAVSSAPTLPTVNVYGHSPTSVMGRTVLSGEELRSVPGTGGDPMKALQSLPGVAVSDDSSSAPAVRGSRPDDNKYYIDFLPVGYLFHMGGLVSTVHSDLVDRFELYSAAFGPEYGDAIGAVLDVTLRRPRTDRLGGTLNVSLLGADVLVEGPVNENQSFYFAAKRSYLDLLIKDVEDKNSGVIVTVPRYHDYQAKYLWNINSSNMLGFHATGAADHLDFKVPVGSTLAAQQPVLAGDGANDTSYNTEALVWDSDLTSTTTNKLAVGQTMTRQTSSIGAGIQVKVASQSSFLREQFKFQPTASHDVMLGGSLNSVLANYDLNVRAARCTEFESNCDPSSATPLSVQDSISANIANMFVKDRWQMNANWAITAGLHHTRDSYLNRNYTEPRLAAEWKYSDSTLFTAGWGRHDQFPAGEQVLSGLGNPSLWHMQATHALLGMSKKLDQGWSWRIEGYQKQFSDLVVADPALNYANGASGQAHGLELLIKKEPTTAFSGWMSVSWSQASRHNDVTGHDFPFAFDQPLIVSLVAQYKPTAKWQFGAKWSYHTGVPDTPVVGASTYPDGRAKPIYGEINSERLPDYHRLDLRAERIVSPRLRYYGEIINAYARQNVSGYSYSADYASRKSETQLPLMVSFGVVVGF